MDSPVSQKTEESTEYAKNDAAFSKFKDYLHALLPSLLEVDDAQVLKDLLARKESVSILSKFSFEPNVQVVYFLKSILREAEDSVEDKSFLSVHSELFSDPSHLVWIAIIKRVPILDDSRPLSAQLQLFSFPSLASGNSNNVAETLHSLVHNAVSPFYDTFIASNANIDSNSSEAAVDVRQQKTITSVTKRKIAELELSLLTLQQNVEIPRVRLLINPIIQKTIEKLAADKNHKISVQDFCDYINDSAFLNRLQSDVNSWVKEVQKVTRLVHESTFSSASQEINFWLRLEQELEVIDNMLKDPPIVMTLEILKSAKRFMATVGFVADTGIKEALDIVQKYNVLMKDFPLSDMLAVIDLSKLVDALMLVFSHFNKKLKLSPYPVKRALSFVDAISREFNRKLLTLLSSKKLIHADYSQFEKVMRICEAIFNEWDDNCREFVNTAREVTRKRNEKFIPIKVNAEHYQLQERLKYIYSFRKQHEQLKQTLLSIIGLGNAEFSADIDIIAELDEAYDFIRPINILDVSVDGTEIWSVAETSYTEKIASVENCIINILRDRLGSARTASEMFRVFSKFNPLFIRQKVCSNVFLLTYISIDSECYSRIPSSAY
jgi:dynein heavy chain 1